MSSTNTQSRSRFIFDPEELNYDFGPDHPFRSRRLVALVELLQSSGLWHSADEQTRLPIRTATIEELSLIHAHDYIDAVQQLGKPEENIESEEERKRLAYLALKYGFAEGDTPVLPRMHDIAARIAGGTLVALSAVMGLPEGGTFSSEEERPLHVFHPAGGLHHAWADRASGFCIYNDASVAIAHVLRAMEAKVLYIDFDAHHGDGVQRSFYDDPRVLTISLHETGRYLFPGTGDVLELGRGLGRGYSVNVPLEPFTEDASYTEAIESLLPPLLMSFAPDVIVTVHGCDTHAWDPLTHLELTMIGIQEQMKLAHQLAHTYCQGRWVALGGGGYDLYRVVPRAWSILWAEMSDQELPERLPEKWIERWSPVWLASEDQEELAQRAMGKPAAHAEFPTIFLDRPEDFPPQPRRWTISHTNRQTVTLARYLLVPPPVRQAFPTARHRSQFSRLFDVLHMREGASPSRTKTIETKVGPLLLRDFCPVSFVERLRPDPGLHAFTRSPEREHQLLMNIAKWPDCALTIAHTPYGEIIGQVTLAPGDDWWEGLDKVLEVTLEVSPNWRGMRIAEQMLAFALEFEALEGTILFAMGLSWHWDLEGLRLSLGRYRQLIKRLFESQNFQELSTNEPNISMEPGNIFMARVGSHVDEHVVDRFRNRLLSTPHLSGLA